MTAFMDLAGRRFGRWLVQGVWEENPPQKRYWRCLCDCGNVRRVLGDNLRSGKSLSCDCLRVEITTKHGMVDHPAYNSWKAAKRRCDNEDNEEYPNYGVRGITFCERWRDFSLFWHDLGPIWKAGLSLERVNVNGNYEPGNVCWATPFEQANNRRRDVIIVNTPHGPMTIKQASETFGIDKKTLTSRVKMGWPDSDLFASIMRRGSKSKAEPEKTQEARRGRLIETPMGKMTIAQAAEAFGVKRVTLQARILNGTPPDKLFEKPRHHSFWHDETN